MEKNRRKNRRPVGRRTTELLIRHIILDLNRTLSATRIAWFHEVGAHWVRELAARLRKEGFKIPVNCPTKAKFTRSWKLIYQFKREHPELLEDPNLSAKVTIGETDYILDGIETQKLVDYLPNIAREVAAHPRYHRYLKRRAAQDLTRQENDIRRIIEKYAPLPEESVN